MNKQQALNKLRSISDKDFDIFFNTLPERVKILIRAGFVNWEKVLPEWYIKYE